MSKNQLKLPDLPKTMPSKEKRLLVSYLKEVLNNLTMKNTNFDGGCFVEFTPNDVTGYVKKVTANNRQFPILILEEFIERYKEE